jgi:hypothetical protein
METYYNVFHRTWWKEATPGTCWPNNLEPEPGERHEIANHVTRADAIELCKRYNSTHEPGRYSDKAEFEES